MWRNYSSIEWKWVIIESKLGRKDIDKKLKLLKNKIKEKSDLNEPEFMMILTAISQLYTRGDDIIVCPINCLKA